MRFATDRFLCVVALAAMYSLMVCPLTARAGFDFDGTPYSQNFDTLTVGGANSWSNDSTLDGWELYRNPTLTAVTTYTLGTGTGTTGAFYSFGSAGSSERALGGVGSGSFNGWIAVGFVNVATTSFISAEVKYDGEQWRNGGNTSMASQTMVMEYGFGPTYAGVSTWNSGFNFTSLQNGATATSLDGNLAVNRTPDIGGTILGLDWKPSETLWFRWIEADDSGSDHGLAIDNFRFSATAAVVPELSNLYTCSGLIGALGLYGLAATLVKRRRAAQVAST